MKLDYNIDDIPLEFIKKNLADYKYDTIVIKYHIAKKYEKLRAKGIKKTDAYMIISEDVCVNWRRVQSILLAMNIT